MRLFSSKVGLVSVQARFFSLKEVVGETLVVQEEEDVVGETLGVQEEEVVGETLEVQLQEDPDHEDGPWQVVGV